VANGLSPFVGSCRGYGSGRDRAPVREDLIESHRVQFAWNRRIGQQRLHFGSEKKCVVLMPVKKWPNTETVT
jgi:hypothetical protein